ncbi:MAG TPA: hotdog fold thioesterase [Syntrophomonas sp.]|nr:hotdog fold thioesterase [Syntrophomonas sp.]HRW12552.1 hotdog fold thioesterase [Syntrophomonas sp.]
MQDVSGFDIDHTVMGTLGIEIFEYTPERVVARMPVTPKVHQPFGLLHGGVSLVIAETVASAGSYQFIDASWQRAVGLEINGNHIRSKASGIVHAVGTPIHVGRRTIIWDIRIYDEEETLICISRCTMAIIEVGPQPAEKRKTDPFSFQEDVSQ